MAKSTSPRPAAPRKPRTAKAAAAPALVAPAIPEVASRSVLADRDAIAVRAYQLFLDSGGVHGRDVEHWLQAETELTGGGLLNTAA